MTPEGWADCPECLGFGCWCQYPPGDLADTVEMPLVCGDCQLVEKCCREKP